MEGMPPTALRTRLRNTAAPMASALIVIVLGLLTYWSMLREAESVRAVEHTHEIVQANRLLLTRMVDAETGERGFVITGDATYLQPFRGAAADVRARLSEIRALTIDNPRQQARLDTLASLIDHRLDALDARIATRKSSGFERARAALIRSGGGKAIMDSLRHIAAKVEAEERALLAMRERSLSRRTQSVLWVVLVGTLAAAVLLTTITFTLTRYAAAQEDLNRALQNQSDELEQQGIELAMLNEGLQERTEDAERANQSKAKFLATMSHDLRTPLNAIMGYVDLIKLGIHGPVTEKQVEDLNRINRSTEHLLSMITDLLNFAKIEAGHIDLKIEDLKVRDVLIGIEALVGPQVAAKELRFGYDECDPDLAITADREKTNQILTNLVTNAVKFTETGGSIRIECDTTEDAVLLSVVDTGPGIRSDRLESVFQPFVQLDAHATLKGRHGVGLGLAISRELARAMKGELSVESVLGRGSSFTLRLPKAAANHFTV